MVEYFSKNPSYLPEEDEFLSIFFSVFLEILKFWGKEGIKFIPLPTFIWNVTFSPSSEMFQFQRRNPFEIIPFPDVTVSENWFRTVGADKESSSGGSSLSRWPNHFKGIFLKQLLLSLIMQCSVLLLMNNNYKISIILLLSLIFQCFHPRSIIDADGYTYRY